jgi:hypothetical protein
MNPIVQARQYLDEELRRAQERLEQERRTQEHDAALLKEIEVAFLAFHNVAGLRAEFQPKRDAPWGWSLWHADKEVARACTHAGQVAWVVLPPYSAPPGRCMHLDSLFWQSHLGNFSRFPRAMARILAEVSVRS